MSKRFENLPGRVEFRVTAFYYPYDGIDTISDPFFGHSEADAVQAIRDYIEHCKSKGKPYHRPDYLGKQHDHSVFPRKPQFPAEKVEEAEEENETENEDESEVVTEQTPVVKVQSEKVSGKGKQALGTFWMVHFGKKHRQRVPSDQEEEYKAKGYVRGGPKTKL